MRRFALALLMAAAGGFDAAAAQEPAARESTPQERLVELLGQIEQRLQEPKVPRDTSRLLYQLGALGTPDAAAALAGLALEQEGWLARTSAWSLRYIDDQHVMVLLRKIASSGPVPARCEALRQLAERSPADLGWIRRRWDREEEPRPKQVVLEILLHHEADDLGQLVWEASDDRDDRLRAAGVRGIGVTRLRKGMSRLEKALGDRSRVVQRNAIHALQAFGGKDGFKALVEAATDHRLLALREDLTRALNSADDEEEIKVLIRALRTRDEVLAMKLIEAIATAAPHAPEDCGKALLRSLGHEDEQVRAVVIRGLVMARVEGAAGALAKRLNHPSRDTRKEALWGLAQLGEVPPDARDKVVYLARHDDRALRRHGTRALGFLPVEMALEPAVGNLRDEDWRVVSAAVDALLMLRHWPSLAPLIATGEARQDVLRSEIADALQLLTGEGFGMNYPAWRRWLGDQDPDAALPDAETAAAAVAALERLRREAGDTASTYHGLTVPRGGVVFVLDISGSMSARRGGGAESDYRRFAGALQRVIGGLPESSMFNVVLFGSAVEPWREELAPASPENVEDAVALLRRTTPNGGTNLYDALARALQMEDVQTIFVLTDGMPSAGRRTAPGDILMGIAQLNRDRGARIHTIAAGSAGAGFLKTLAESNGGEAVDLRQGMDAAGGE